MPLKVTPYSAEQLRGAGYSVPSIGWVTSRSTTRCDVPVQRPCGGFVELVADTMSSGAPGRTVSATMLAVQWSRRGQVNRKTTWMSPPWVTLPATIRAVSSMPGDSSAWAAGPDPSNATRGARTRGISSERIADALSRWGESSVDGPESNLGRGRDGRILQMA